MNNKRGMMMELIFLVIIGIVCVLFFAGWIYGNNLVNTQLSNTALNVNGVNVTNAVANTYGYAVTGFDQLKLIAVFIFIGYILATLIVAYYTPEVPLLAIMYFVFTILVAWFANSVSNDYMALLNNSVLGPTLQGFSVMNIFINNLPGIIIAVGFIGAALSIGNFIRSKS